VDEQVDRPSRWPRRLLALGTAVYSVYVPWLYVSRVHPIFDYMGFSYNRPGAIWMVIAVTLAALPGILWLPLDFERPSDLIVTVIYLVVYVPSLTIPFLALSDPREYLWMALALLGCFFVITRFTRQPALAIPRSPFTGINLDRLMLVLAIASSAWIAIRLGFRGVPALLDVYDVRSDYVERLEDAPVILSYVINWLGHVVYAYFIARGIYSRRTWMWSVGILGNLYVYTLTGFKSVLFSMVLILLVAILLRARTHRAVRLIGGVLAALFLFGLIDDLVGGYLATGLFTQRVIMVPGLLTGYYYDFFSTNPKLLLLHSIFRWAGTYPYPAPYPVLIAQYYLNMDGFANANYLADAYANFGIPGMFAFSLLLGLLLWVLDSLCEGMDVGYAASLSIVAFFTITNAALLTGMLSFGILFLLLVLWLHPLEESGLGSPKGA
jgi:hypothetical protein